MPNNRIGAIVSQDNTLDRIQNPFKKKQPDAKGAFVATLIKKEDFSKTATVPGLPASAGFIDVQNRYS